MAKMKKCGCPVGFNCCCSHQTESAQQRELSGQDTLSVMKKNRTRFKKGMTWEGNMDSENWQDNYYDGD